MLKKFRRKLPQISQAADVPAEIKSIKYVILLNDEIAINLGTTPTGFIEELRWKICQKLDAFENRISPMEEYYKIILGVKASLPMASWYLNSRGRKLRKLFFTVDNPAYY